MPELTTRTESPDAVVVPPGTIVPGRARGAAPLRREGPAKLTGAALYTDDLVFPGAWYGADDPLDRRPRPAPRARPRPELRLVDGRRRDRGRHPRREHRQLDQGRPADPRPGRRRDPHHAEPIALIAAPDRATLRAARHAHHGRGPSRSRRSSTRSSSSTSSPVRDRARRVEAAFAAADLVLEGEYRVGHQEQLYIENNAMIAVPGRGRRGHRPRLAPVPVLRPHGAQAGARPRRPPGARSSRPRPAAGSAARRSTRRSSRSTPRSSRCKPGARSG